MNSLNCISKAVKAAECGEKVNNGRLSLLDIRELQRINKELETTGESKTIMSNEYVICICCGLKTIPEGIGWRIYKEDSV